MGDKKKKIKNLFSEKNFKLVGFFAVPPPPPPQSK